MTALSPGRFGPLADDVLVSRGLWQYGADGAALAVNAGVLVVRAQVQVLDVHPADLGGAGAADVGRLEQHPVAQHAEGHVLARPPGADRLQHRRDVDGGRRPGQRPGTSMASMRSIGLAASSSCRTAHLQNEATAARLRVAGACPAISPRNARTGAAVSPAISPSWWAANPVRSGCR
jgi:hypothetical protein